MSRIVFDTNIYISALMFGGLPGDLLDLAFAGMFVLVTSAALLDELDAKLRGKFQVLPSDAQMVRAKLEQVAEVVSRAQTVDVIEDDPDDDRVLECAIAGRADCIVSGDRHLLKLQRYEGISIVTARQLMEKLMPRA